MYPEEQGPVYTKMMIWVGGPTNGCKFVSCKQTDMAEGVTWRSAAIDISPFTARMPVKDKAQDCQVRITCITTSFLLREGSSATREGLKYRSMMDLMM